MAEDDPDALLAKTEAQQREHQYRERVKPPPYVRVELPGGLYLPEVGTYERRAEVREMNGYDEEAVQRLSKGARGSSEVLLHVLDRCVEKIGDDRPTPETLNMLYTGDWDALLLAIRIASFGNEIRWGYVCPSCEKRVDVEVDLAEEVPTRALKDPSFSYEGRRVSYTCGFPRGGITRNILSKGKQNPATVVSETLYGCLDSIDGKQVDSMAQIRSMPLQDRDGLMSRILSDMPAVLLGEVKKACPECSEEGEIGLSLAALFQGRMGGI